MSPIILDVCRANKIHPHEFFARGARGKRLSRARRIAIFRLQRAGLSGRAIARIIRRSYSTVQYWLYPKTRKRKLEYNSKYYRDARATA